MILPRLFGCPFCDMSLAPTRQGRTRPPTTAMLTGQNSVSMPCLWKIPTTHSALGIGTTDVVAWVFPFHSDLSPNYHQTGATLDSVDRSDPHAVHVHKMLTRVHRLKSCESSLLAQLHSCVGSDTTELAHPAWIITSRFGDRVNGNRIHRSTQDDIPKRATRVQQCDAIRQGAGPVPAIRASAASEFYLANKDRECVKLVDVSGNDVELPLLEFVGGVINLTPPGDHKLEVSCSFVCERSKIQSK
jgi:hypothetical protein